MVLNPSFQTLSWFLCFLAVWLLGVSFFLFRSISHYNRLVRGKDKKGLQEILERVLKEIRTSKKEIDALKEKVLGLEENSLLHIQKIGLLKFNPFKDIGGEQSFVLSLLDAKDNGVVITSLHSRETTRFYIKRVKKGKGVNYELSKEEKETIKKASKI